MKGETNRVKRKRYKFRTAQRINRKYKDRLFRFVFQDKKDLLELYNAINGTDYQDAEMLEINTLEDVLYLGMKNDLSFLLCDTMNLYEHQSTWNENMPLRGLLYFAELYQRYLEENGYRLTGTGRRLPLPFPRYVVFYNGTKEEPDQMQLLLSDSFQSQGKDELPSLECRAVVLNINYGHNQAIMERCRRLKDYSEFIEEIRRNLRAGMVLEDAVEQGIEACMNRGILEDILRKSKMEVRKMLLTEYDEKAEREYLRKEAIEMGLEEGRAMGLEQGLEQGLQQGLEQGLQQGLEQGLQQGLEQGLQQGIQQGIQKGICAFILDNLEENIPKKRILSKLERRFFLTSEQAREYFEKYGREEQ